MEPKKTKRAFTPPLGVKPEVSEPLLGVFQYHLRSPFDYTEVLFEGVSISRQQTLKPMQKWQRKEGGNLGTRVGYRGKLVKTNENDGI